jgi:hypothetical protein
MLVLGAAQVLLSNLSLKQWRAGKRSTPITLLEAGELVLHSGWPSIATTSIPVRCHEGVNEVWG